MPGTGTEIWWTLIVGTAALLSVAVIVVATIIVSQRRFITVERQKLEALDESERKYRTLIERMNEGVMKVTNDDVIQYVNKQFCELVGYSEEELLGEVASEIFLDEEYRGIIKRKNFIRTEGIADEYEIQIKKKSGEKIWVHISGAPIYDVGGKVVGSIGIHSDIGERKRSEERLRISHDQLRELSGHLQSVREEERTRISREIHDELGQMLTVLKMDLALLQRKLRKDSSLDFGEAQEDITSMSKTIDSTIQSVRRIATELRPEVLDELGFQEAIEWEIEMFEKRTGIKSEFLSNVNEIKLDRESSTTLFRIFQETLTNVARHAHATEVTTRLNHQNGFLILEIKDNGCGINKHEVSAGKSLGLIGMKERVLLLGGELSIKGEEGRGTVVSVRIPVSESSTGI